MQNSCASAARGGGEKKIQTEVAMMLVLVAENKIHSMIF